MLNRVVYFPKTPIKNRIHDRTKAVFMVVWSKLKGSWMSNLWTILTIDRCTTILIRLSVVLFSPMKVIIFTQQKSRRTSYQNCKKQMTYILNISIISQLIENITKVAAALLVVWTIIFPQGRVVQELVPTSIKQEWILERDMTVKLDKISISYLRFPRLEVRYSKTIIIKITVRQIQILVVPSWTPIQVWVLARWIKQTPPSVKVVAQAS